MKQHKMKCDECGDGYLAPDEIHRGWFRCHCGILHKGPSRLERAIEWADNSPVAMIAACAILGLGLGIALYLAF